MNLLLLQPNEVGADGVAVLAGRRLEHAREVLRVQHGETLKVGVKGAQVGTATVLEGPAETLRLRVMLDAPPPPRAGISLVLAIPRPKALKRVLPAVASLGVDRVVLVNAAKVEKSYFDSKVLAPEFIEGLLELGLEQARDTVPPRVEVRERFRPFVEDELGAWAGPGRRLVPHPTAESGVPRVPAKEPLVVAIGPDGGWTDFEVELLAKQGFTPISLGPRILRVEVAVPAIIGALRFP